MIKRRADSGSEDQAVILPESVGQQPVLGLAVDMLTERQVGFYLGKLVGATGFEPVTPRL
jgi:hypothetical protein